ncbi:hypothetical protein BAE44_0006012 [Dichanthelium oligosanthes]|uniref:WRKY domain-containing protein n=1 Tax=Dichanthelium oligosanthes TaxID=888268 RepID=A0A1E5W6A9_9POAL|nr:hypothetical protein BAE44_0006012 [Dichanthelium oligosanthes]
MRQQQQLLTKLRAIVVPLLPADDPSAELVVHLLEDVLRCNVNVISQLERGNTYYLLPAVRKSTIHDRNVEQVQKSFNRRRRKNKDISRSLVTDTPHYDGHQWRKYGQKHINGLKHPRLTDTAL